MTIVLDEGEKYNSLSLKLNKEYEYLTDKDKGSISLDLNNDIDKVTCLEVTSTIVPEEISPYERSEYIDVIEDTIVALATPVGFGGIAIVRVSGDTSQVLKIANEILRFTPKPRYAHYSIFYEKQSDNIIDKGIALYFSSPNSYTGEDVLELHCHGGPIVTDRIISEILKINNILDTPDNSYEKNNNSIRLAEPGEFTKRAWLNNKMDLAQVEAVSDLINATSIQAASSAVNTLNGKFSDVISLLLNDLIYLRTYVEAAIDFSDQEIDFISDGKVISNIINLEEKILDIITTTKQGVILQEGVNIVIAGEPNAGKSSLLNSLCKKETAIVTEIPGTTRDVIKTNLNIKGVPVSLIDTAGLRETNEVVEQYGVQLACKYINTADFVFFVVDGSLNKNKELLDVINSESDFVKIVGYLKRSVNDENNKYIKELLEIDLNKLIIIINKVDLISSFVNNDVSKSNLAFISAKNNLGIDDLEKIVLEKIGFNQTNEGVFIARRRHLESLSKVKQSIVEAKTMLEHNMPCDLIAEELKSAQLFLGEITGEYLPDDLLGNIFSSFCIGK